EWQAFYHQWVLTLSSARNPVNGTADCGSGQRPDVWFLGPPTGEGKQTATRSCRVPEGTALYVLLGSDSCDNRELTNAVGGPNFSPTRRGLDDCVSQGAGLTHASMEIDGVPVPNVEAFRTRSTRFSYAIDETNTPNAYGIPPGLYAGLSEGIGVL